MCTLSFATPCVLLYRNALTLLFEAVGLKSRKAGDGGEAGYGIPDRGCEDSEAVIKKVRQVQRVYLCDKTHVQHVGHVNTDSTCSLVIWDVGRCISYHDCNNNPTLLYDIAFVTHVPHWQ